MRFSNNRKVIITLLSKKESDYKKYVQIWDKYETQLNLCIKAWGKRQALLRYKECYVFLRNKLLYLNTEPIPFCRIDKRGLPKPLWPLRPLLKGSREEHRLALVIARTYESIQLPIDYSVDNITNGASYTETAFNDVNQQFKIFLGEFTNKFPWYLGTLQKQSPLEKQVFTTLSKGPNGPAVACAHLDAKGVIQQEELYHAIRNLNFALRQNWITKWMEEQASSYESKELYFTGRLGFSAEPGGKTRIFAIADYWSQCSLKVIQTSLYDTLKSISTDSTRDQDGSFKKLLSKSRGRKTYCFDLSAASDRIPVVMQEHRLDLLQEGLGELWRKVMTERDFKIVGHDKKVRWKIGQPLGLLSSFPSFALWHHDIIQYAANFERINNGKPLKFFKDYSLLGDDVVIYDTKVANTYQYLMELIGVPINLNKSIIGTDEHSQIEFTKRLALNGMEMSSIKNNILNKDSIINMIDLVDILLERDFISSDTGHYMRFPFLSSKDEEKLNFLFWARSQCATPFKGYSTCEISRESYNLKLKDKRSENLRNKAMQLDKYLTGQKPVDIYYKKHSIPYNAKALGLEALNESQKLHPLVWAINQIGLELSMILSVLWDDESLEMSPVEYMPLISTKSFFQRNNAKAEYISELILSIHQELLTKVNDD